MNICDTFDLGWLPDAPSATLLTLPPQQGKNRMRRLAGQGKDREIIYCHKNRLDLGKSNLLPIKIE